ncbi:MAG: mannose-1-phosphate guanylyltransferase [Bacteroides sp.]|nr:mannose-1-phosphate guanylyltransferase [Bacteroides sp.]MCM1379007.1 mannose-1-phosphate guanylyltransferase [Bacteroides sp.]MCM1445623.1 mannose-1-phosphate guanylyltransferase [Prevotella sp.]
MRYCVIMCGGVGSRFWPASRSNKPKQFLDFMGTGRTLLQMTFDRIAPLIPAERVIIVTNADYEGLVRQQLPDVKPENILLEPARRNTAPCIAWAARHIQALDPEASMAVMPSDHLITRERIFHEAIERGFSFVESNPALLTLGIRPSRPETGYGYIQRGDLFAEGINRVKTFTEKPNEEMAQLFLSTGEFLWNAGVFLWTTKNLLKGLAQYAPEIYARFNAPEGVFGNPQEENAYIAREFPACPSISIDYALMEKASNVYVEEVDPGWSDVGTWGALHELSPKDRHGNVIHDCSVMAYETSGTIISESNPNKLILIDGLKDFVVADTDDVLLICPLNKEQQIKKYVNDISLSLGNKYL